VGAFEGTLVQLDELAHRQRHLGHQYALLTEGDLERFRDLGNLVCLVSDKGEDGDPLLLTLPEPDPLSDGETIKARGHLLSDELSHHAGVDLTSVGDVATKEQLELHGLFFHAPTMAQNPADRNRCCATS